MLCENQVVWVQGLPDWQVLLVAKCGCLVLLVAASVSLETYENPQKVGCCAPLRLLFKQCTSAVIPVGVGNWVWPVKVNIMNCVLFARRLFFVTKRWCCAFKCTSRNVPGGTMSARPFPVAAQSTSCIMLWCSSYQGQTLGVCVSGTTSQATVCGDGALGPPTPSHTYLAGEIP